MTRTARLLLLPALWLIGAGAAQPDSRPELQWQFPDIEDRELLALGGLEPLGERTASGEVIRYTLRRGFGYGTQPTARIVQASWPFGDNSPSVLRVELAHRNGAWHVAERRQARMHPRAYEQLARNVTAAASVLGPPGPRGAMTVCSHADSSRLDLSLFDGFLLRLSRTAHCSDTTAAVVAGELVGRAVDFALEADSRPPDAPGS
jgi:hypothetical protein